MSHKQASNSKKSALNLARSGEASEVVRLALEVVERITKCNHCHFLVVDPRTGETVVVMQKQGGEPASPWPQDENTLRYSTEHGITGYAATHKITVRVNDVSTDLRYLNHWPDTKSELAIPLLRPFDDDLSQSEVFAIINSEHNEVDHFTIQHEKEIEQLLNQEELIQALWDARNSNYVMTFNPDWQKMLHTANKLIPQLTTIRNHNNLYKTVLKNLLLLDENITSAAIMNYIPGENNLAITWIGHRNNIINANKPFKIVEVKLRQRIPVDNSLTGKALVENKVKYFPADAMQNFYDKKFQQKFKVQGMLSIPISRNTGTERTEMVGCINLYTSRREFFFPLPIRAIAEHLCFAMGTAILISDNDRQLLAFRETTDVCSRPVFDADTLYKLANVVSKNINNSSAAIYLRSNEGTDVAELRASVGSAKFPETYDKVDNITGNTEPLHLGREELASVYRISTKERVVSLLTQPLTNGEHLFGLIRVVVVGHWTEEDRMTLAAVGRPLSFALTSVWDKICLSHVVAHQLNRPLNAVSMYLQRLIEEDPSLAQKLEKALDLIKLGSGVAYQFQEFENIINKSNYQIKIFEEDNLNDILHVEYRLAQISFMSRAQGIEVMWQHFEKAPPIRVHHDLFASAIRNVLTNSILYRVDSYPIVVNISDINSNDLTITIVNRSRRLKDDETTRLRDPYYRAPSNQDMFVNGSGKGLYIADAILKAHGGALEINHLLIDGQADREDFEVRIRIPLHNEKDNTFREKGVEV